MGRAPEDDLLDAISRHLGNESTSHLLVVQTGKQTMIHGIADACAGGDGSKCVQFLIELVRGSYDDQTGEWRDTPDWTIDASIDADCQHIVDHGGLEPVHDLPSERAVDPVEAARAFHRATKEIVRSGRQEPLEHWLRLVSELDTNGVD
jgi:hypothetical protein